MPIYEFTCPKAHKTEKIVAVGTESVTCACGKTAKKVWSIPAEAKIQGGTPRHYPRTHK
jgi:hypothetical protein